MASSFGYRDAAVRSTLGLSTIQPRAVVAPSWRVPLIGHSGVRVASTEVNRAEKRPAGALPEIPDKLYFKIGEVARLLDLPAYVLRFWETEFPQLKPGKGGTGQRLYRRRDVNLALRIRSLLYDEGYTIPGARQHLKAEARVREEPAAAAAEPDPDPSPDGTAASIRLRRMRTELREIASLLASPTEAESPLAAKAAHRGLHVAPVRRKSPVAGSASLFPEDGGPGQR